MAAFLFKWLSLARAQRDEDFVELCKLFAESTQAFGRDGFVERVLRRIEVAQYGRVSAPRSSKVTVVTAPAPSPPSSFVQIRRTGGVTSM